MRGKQVGLELLFATREEFEDRARTSDRRKDVKKHGLQSLFALLKAGRRLH